MRYILLFIGLTVELAGFAQGKVKYVGTFGDTSHIELEISTNNEKDYSGRYRFENTKLWILLKGAMYYDRRNKIAQNLVLYQFSNEKDSAVFDLYMEGKSLTGTWQLNKHSPILPVSLTVDDPNKPNPFDGTYTHQNQNELKVKTISSNTVEINMVLKPTENCTEIKLNGTLLKVGSEWKGSLPDQNDKGDISIILSFDGQQANVEMIPAFTAPSKCQIDKAIYMKKVPKGDG